MKEPKNSSRPKSSKIWIFIVLIALAAAGGFGYTYWNQSNAAHAEAAAPKVTTKQVRTGTITLATSGSVTLVPSKETALAFTVSGNVVELNTAVGDQVKKGQVLAKLDNLADLQAEIKNTEQDLASAQQELAGFKAKAPANLANAELAVIDAQKTVEDAQGSVIDPNAVRCSKETRKTYYNRYERAVDALNKLGDGGGNADYYLKVLVPQKKIVDQAKALYDACAGFTSYQIASSETNLSVAQAKLKTAQETLDTLTKNNGLNPVDLATAENKVVNAQGALDTAKDNLAGATLTAPFDGTILSVAGKLGDSIEVTTRNPSVTFITISDLAHPQLTFSIDETDMTMVAPGEPATITFDAFSNRTFKGAVTRVDPVLSSSNGTSKVTGIIEMDLSQEKDVPNFPKNLSGSVQIIQASAENVLLIPIEALREQSDGSYAVYVKGADGQPALKTVTIGLQDVASVEIKSGLSASDTVITSGIQ